MQPSKNRATGDAIRGLWVISLTTFIISALYFGREVLIPFSLAALLTFLLAPMVNRLERWLGRIGAVLVVGALICGAAGVGAYVLTRQLVDLVTKIPDYKVNIQTKLRSFHSPTGGVFSRFTDTVEELKQELPGGTPPPVVVTKSAGQPETATASPPNPPVPAVPVKVVEASTGSPVELAQAVIAPLLGPLGTGALVILLVVCMLMRREDLRSRLIRLIGQGRISATTRAMDDAGARVSRYLLMQLLVNVTYGIAVAVGLLLIGVPNAILWGAFAVVLRFIPYIGPWIAAAFPIVLSLAVSPNWTMPLLTIGLFVVLELLSNNLMEPWLYGSSTGVSAIALIIAAVFWTWLWGTVGLVLATPLTVCLVVMGRHIPRLAFLSVILSDEEALTPAEDCYHRMLTAGEKDDFELIEAYLKAHSLTELYGSVLLPVLTSAEMDYRQEMLDDEQHSQVEQSLRDIIEDLGSRPLRPPESESEETQAVQHDIPAPLGSVYCVPARATRDELAGAMCAHVLRQNGFDARYSSGTLNTAELVSLTEKGDPDIVCISVVAPSTVIHARYLCTKLRSAFPRLKIAVALWGITEGQTEATRRLRESGADEVFTTFSEAVAQLPKLAPPLPDTMMAAPIPPDEQERSHSLKKLGLLDTDAEALFDRTTAKLARVFEVPIALISVIDGNRQFFKSQTGLPSDLAAAREAPRDVSVCGHVVALNDVLVIEDLARDRRFAGNPFLKQHGLRFYAGAPLHAPDGQPIGSLCLLDTKPRQLTAREIRLLREYAVEISDDIATRVAEVEHTA